MAGRLAASAVYYSILVSWVLLFHSLPYVITSINTDIYIIVYGLVSISKIQLLSLHGQPLTMLCTVAYFVP